MELEERISASFAVTASGTAVLTVVLRQGGRKGKLKLQGKGGWLGGQHLIVQREKAIVGGAAATAGALLEDVAICRTKWPAVFVQLDMTFSAEDGVVAAVVALLAARRIVECSGVLGDGETVCVKFFAFGHHTRKVRLKWHSSLVEGTGTLRIGNGGSEFRVRVRVGGAAVVR